MSINRAPDPPQPPSRQLTQRHAQKAEQQVSSSDLSSASASIGSRSQGRNSSYTVLGRDILYRTINEFQLSGSMLSAYTDLLNILGFDLTPLISQGQTWYFCRGKIDDRPCERMVPEVYLRTSVGKVLRAADKPELRGDELVEELATALSYAICSQHHRTIHKVARALEARQVVEQWREDRPSIGTTTQSIKEFRPSTPSDQLEEYVIDEGGEHDSFVSARTINLAERLEVERQYQDILRASTREHGASGSDAASSRTSASVSVYSGTRKARDWLGS